MENEPITIKDLKNISESERWDLYKESNRAKRENPPIGFACKLAFYYDKDNPKIGEFLWVSIDHKEHGEDIFYGKLEGVPEKCQNLKIGNDVQFTSEHIFEIMELG